MPRIMRSARRGSRPSAHACGRSAAGQAREQPPRHMRKCPMLSSATAAMAATGVDAVEVDAVAGVHLEPSVAGPSNAPSSSARRRRSAARVSPARTASQKAPVCSSTTWAPTSAEAQTWPGVALDEQRHAAPPSSCRRRTAAATARWPRSHVEAALGGALGAAARARGRRRWGAVAQGDLDHLVGDGHLEVERALPSSRHSAESASISASEMWRRSSRRWAVIPSAPASSAWRAARRGSGWAPAASVPDGRHVVDVDAQAQARS